MLAVWQSEESLRSSCGTYSWEWEADPQAYQWDFDRCPGCAQNEHGLEELAALRRSANQPGMSLDYSGWSVRLYPRGSDGV